MIFVRSRFLEEFHDPNTCKSNIFLYDVENKSPLMELLFSTHLASFEAWLMVLCVIVFFGIYLFDGISFLQRVYAVLKPTKSQSKSNSPIADDNSLEVTSPILEPITQAEVEAHDREKVEAEEKHEQEVIESEIFEEKILEEIKEQEQIEEIGENIEKVEESKNTEEETKNAEELKEMQEIKEMKEEPKEIEEVVV
jgi:hypothetical protein